MDFSLVCLMIAEVWVLPLIFMLANQQSGGADLKSLSAFRLFRLLRLSRVGRVGRLLKYVPEILVMLKSIAAASRAIICTLLLLSFMMYVTGIIFTGQSAGTSIEHMFP